MKKATTGLSDHCRERIRAVTDTQDLISGKWKLAIIAALYYNKSFRFMDLCRHVENIAPKVLSKELKDLEMNRLVKRTVYDSMPVAVEYELTSQGKNLKKVIETMAEWGMKYREEVFV